MAEQASEPSDRHKVGYTTEALDFFAQRRASTHAAFFLPYLRPGMRLLDCGSGPGSITADLAAIVRPAGVVGIDIDPDHISRAQEHASQRDLPNLHFEQGDITRLPFPDETFDAVFTHGVVEYLADPVGAFAGMHRVLKLGGILGARHGDWGGFLFAPTDPLAESFFDLFQKLMRQTGGDPYFGRHQLAALRRAGFAKAVVSASYDCWTATPDAARSAARFAAGYCVSPEFVGPLTHLKLAERPQLEQISAALRVWGEDEAAFAAEAWGEAVAWKT